MPLSSSARFSALGTGDIPKPVKERQNQTLDGNSSGIATCLNFHRCNVPTCQQLPHAAVDLFSSILQYAAQVQISLVGVPPPTSGKRPPDPHSQAIQLLSRCVLVLTPLVPPRSCVSTHYDCCQQVCIPAATNGSPDISAMSETICFCSFGPSGSCQACNLV